MFCDLAVAGEAKAADGQCWGSVLGECLLQLGRWEEGTVTAVLPWVPMGTLGFFNLDFFSIDMT